MFHTPPWSNSSFSYTYKEHSVSVDEINIGAGNEVSTKNDEYAITFDSGGGELSGS